MTGGNWQTAHAMAREFANRETDVNEVHKAATYARTHGDGAALFALLDAIVRDGRYLVRSGRTLDYYRDIREVCGSCLGRYRSATGEDARELAEILGWAVRLTRYYGTDAGAAELAEQQRNQTPHSPRVAAPATERPTQPRPTPSRQAPPTRQETNRERVTLVTTVKGGKAQVRTAEGAEVPCTGLPAYPVGKPGAACRADVTYEGCRPVKAFFKGWV